MLFFVTNKGMHKRKQRAFELGYRAGYDDGLHEAARGDDEYRKRILGSQWLREYSGRVEGEQNQ